MLFMCYVRCYIPLRKYACCILSLQNNCRRIHRSVHMCTCCTYTVYCLLDVLWVYMFVYMCMHILVYTLYTYWPFVVHTQYVHMYVVPMCIVTVYAFVHTCVHTTHLWCTFTACIHAHMYTVDPHKWMYNRLLCVYSCVQNCTCCVQLQACMCRTRLRLSCFRSASETACRDCLCVWANFPQAGAKIFRHASLSLLPGLLCIRQFLSFAEKSSLAVVISVL